MLPFTEVLKQAKLSNSDRWWYYGYLGVIDGKEAGGGQLGG